MKYPKNVVKAAMELKQIKPMDIAKVADRTEDTVYKALRGLLKSKRIEQTVEKMLNPELSAIMHIYLENEFIQVG